MHAFPGRLYRLRPAVNPSPPSAIAWVPPGRSDAGEGQRATLVRRPPPALPQPIGVRPWGLRPGACTTAGSAITSVVLTLLSPAAA